MSPTASTSALLLSGLVAASCGCGGNGRTGPDATTINFDRRALLAHIANDIVLPTLESFDADTDALAGAVDAWCAALASPDEDARRADAQAAWRAAMSTWQRAELMQVGPVAMDSGALHDVIYSWPTVASCAVDQEVMLRWQDPAAHDISTRLTNRRGLPALEYLLFHADLATTCPPTSAPPGWSTLPDADKRAARCGYAQAASDDLAAQAQTLADAWSPAGGDYAGVLAAAGESGSPFASAHAAVNVVTDAMFYVDFAVKDMKLGQPAGITLNSCATVQEPCPRDLESQWAAHSKENILANLRAFQALFLGDGPTTPGGLGFDDFLRAAGAGALATTLQTDVAAAIAAVEAIPGSMDSALTAAPETVVAAHAAVKAVTDNLKSQFLTVLALDLPDELGDDTD